MDSAMAAKHGSEQVMGEEESRRRMGTRDGDEPKRAGEGRGRESAIPRTDGIFTLEHLQRTPRAVPAHPIAVINAIVGESLFLAGEHVQAALAHV